MLPRDKLFHLKKISQQIQKDGKEKRLPGAGGRGHGGSVLNGDVVFVGEDEKVWGRDW